MSLCLYNETFASPIIVLLYRISFNNQSKMSYGGGQKVQKVMVQPINLIFR